MQASFSGVSLRTSIPAVYKMAYLHVTHSLDCTALAPCCCWGCRLLIRHVSCVMCHVSCVMCHVSCVVCRVSCVMCHVLSVMCRVSCVCRKLAQLPLVCLRALRHLRSHILPCTLWPTGKSSQFSRSRFPDSNPTLAKLLHSLSGRLQSPSYDAAEQEGVAQFTLCGGTAGFSQKTSKGSFCPGGCTR